MKSTTIILFTLIISACIKNDTCISLNNIPVSPKEINFKQEMREFVIAISQYSKNLKPDFFIIPQNGIELVTINGLETGEPHLSYLNAIDANGQEGLFYGYEKSNKATPNASNTDLMHFLNISKDSGNTILVADYCSTNSKMNKSYWKNADLGFISLAANHVELDNIPAFPMKDENNAVVVDIAQVENFLYLINLEKFKSKREFITAISATNYDLLITDLFFNDGTAFSAAEINELKNKANGGRRLVISYMSIGEAENYRYYWQSEWNRNKPIWLDTENTDWTGNYKVKYWYPEWQHIIYGKTDSYLKKILNANFDGVYLDIIDAFEFYEN